ncbi:hypothetical protein PORCRE_1818 [Porphyromonas crevioricanis JCM 15906]|uniref:Uncharacterized protein n=1 Tax=Porphyromonas crevioricanis JCM 15906 TaxID=1305617 RepID=T1CIT4_9PORP|nr:hypothetical protein PORCRE_1818 [Porphyromonas crevioricanis JCM 15906]
MSNVFFNLFLGDKYRTKRLPLWKVEKHFGGVSPGADRLC